MQQDTHIIQGQDSSNKRRQIEGEPPAVNSIQHILIIKGY